MVTRLAVAVALIAAIVAQLRSSIDFAGKDGDRDTLNVLVNFFSYFTIDSNILTIVMLLVGAAFLARGDALEPKAFTVFRASVTTYMVITGVVYNVLLRGELTQGATVAWSNELLHVVGPAYVLVDWLVAPGRNRLEPRTVLAVLAFPIAWLAYTLVRGPFATDPYLLTSYWYPYPFINPETSTGGYASVAAYAVGISVVFAGVAAGVVWLTRRASTTA